MTTVNTKATTWGDQERREGGRKGRRQGEGKGEREGRKETEEEKRGTTGKNAGKRREEWR